MVQSVPAATDLVIDGVVGISGSGPLRPAAAEVFAAVDAAGIPVVAVDIPSGIDVHTGASDGPHVHAVLTVTFGGLKPVHALGDCGVVELVDIGLDLPPPTSLASMPPTSPRGGRCRGRATTSTPRASPASWPGRRPTPVRRCCARARPSRPRRAWCATREALRNKYFRIGRRSSHRPPPRRRDGCRRGSSGPGLGTDDGRRRAHCGSRSTPTCR